MINKKKNLFNFTCFEIGMYYVLICEKKIGKKFTCQKFYLLKIPKFGKSGKVGSAELFVDGSAKKGQKGRVR